MNSNDVILAAKNQIDIVNTTDTDSTRTTNESKSASVGVLIGTGGFGVSTAMSKANSDLATQNNNHVKCAQRREKKLKTFISHKKTKPKTRSKNPTAAVTTQSNYPVR
ncbi:hemagglutinin repeat-containing protein [Burkholderia sp. 22PA0099]